VKVGLKHRGAHVESLALRRREARQRSAEHRHGVLRIPETDGGVVAWGRIGGHRRRRAFIASGDTDQRGYEQRIATHGALPE